MTVSDWVHGKSWPPEDHYMLLGHLRLDPSTDALLETIRAANIELSNYQNAPQQVRENAQRVQREIGRAAATFSKPSERTAYDAKILRTLADQYRASAGADPTKMSDWLAGEGKVHPGAVASVAAAMPAFAASKPIELAAVEPPPRELAPGRATAYVTPPPTGTTPRPPTSGVGTTGPITPPKSTVPSGAWPDYGVPTPIKPLPWPKPKRPLHVREWVIAICALVTVFSIATAAVYSIWRTPGPEQRKVTLTLTVIDPGVEVFVDDDPIPLERVSARLPPERKAEVSLRPGIHQIRSTWPRRVDMIEPVTLEPGIDKTHDIRRPLPGASP